MKNLLKLTLAISISFNLVSNMTALAEGMVFEPINIDNKYLAPSSENSQQKTTKLQISKQANINCTQNDTVNSNLQNILLQLDSAQVEKRNQLIEIKNKYSDIDSQYKLIKQERKITAKEVKSLERRIKSINKAKENIRKNM